MQEDMKEELATKIATKINLQKNFFFLGIISWKGASFFNGGCFSVEGGFIFKWDGGRGEVAPCGAPVMGNHDIWSLRYSKYLDLFF